MALPSPPMHGAQPCRPACVRPASAFAIIWNLGRVLDPCVPPCCSFRISAPAPQSDTKVLWLPATPGKDCPTFCAAQGLASVNGGSETAALCAQVTSSGAWYEGAGAFCPNFPSCKLLQVYRMAHLHRFIAWGALRAGQHPASHVLRNRLPSPAAT